MGDSELALRFPSAMAGILAIAVMYALGRELYTHREGMLAAAFMAVLWMPIYFSQEARPYALMLFLSMLSMLLWVKTIRPLTRGRRPSLLLAIGYLVTAILASYSHYFGLLLIALEGLAAGLILLRRRELIYLPALYAPVAIAYVPWIRAVLYQAGRQSPAHLTADPALIRYFFWFIFNRSEGLGRAPTIVPEGLGLLFFVFLFAMLLVGAFRFYRSSDRRVNNLLESPTLLLLLWLLAPLISAYLISVQVNPVLINKNLIVVAPAAYLLLARAVMVLPLRQSLRYAIGASLVFVFLLHLLLSVGHYSRPQRPQIREAVQYVVDHYDQNEEALIVGYKIGLYRYYLPETFDERGIDHVISSGQIEYPKAIDRKLDERGTEYLWLLSGFEIGPPEQLLDNLGAKMALVDHVSLYEADVWLYRR